MVEGNDSGKRKKRFVVRLSRDIVDLCMHGVLVMIMGLFDL